MLKQIQGLHHVTSMAADARKNNHFFTDVLGLRRVKKTVNFDEPSVYHLYYGDAAGTPGTVMTYFPFPHIASGRRGVGEVGETQFAVPKGSLPYWIDRFASTEFAGTVETDQIFGANRLRFHGPDGAELALIEVEEDKRMPWTGAGVSEQVAIRGFNGVRLRLNDIAATQELLEFMGYQRVDHQDNVTRLRVPGGNGADTIDLEKMTHTSFSRQGAGSVHHVAFAVENAAAQTAVRNALMDTGYQVTPIIDRNYFRAIYFRTPGGVLFEVATNEPGFGWDEDAAHLGEALKLPDRYEPHRAKIETLLEPLE